MNRQQSYCIEQLSAKNRKMSPGWSSREFQLVGCGSGRSWPSQAEGRLTDRLRPDTERQANGRCGRRSACCHRHASLIGKRTVPIARAEDGFGCTAFRPIRRAPVSPTATWLPTPMATSLQVQRPACSSLIRSSPGPSGALAAAPADRPGSGIDVHNHPPADLAGDQPRGGGDRLGERDPVADQI
jgi:hypothetical protein